MATTLETLKAGDDFLAQAAIETPQFEGEDESVSVVNLPPEKRDAIDRAIVAVFKDVLRSYPSYAGAIAIGEEFLPPFAESLENLKGLLKYHGLPY